MTAEAEFKSDLLRTLQARGYIHQITHPEELDAAAASGRVTGYIGFDATAPSLHVGNLITIMMLRRLQQAGHKPIVIVGGGTTKVGDPSGKDETRQLRTHEEIQANIASQKQAFAKFLTFGDGPTDALLVNNADWLDKLGYVEFLRNYGVHFTINRMLTFDSVRLRLEREQPMTFLEFNYMLMQATDFLELERKHGCQLQMGGSDQWGNILNGVELIRRVDHKQAYGLGPEDGQDGLRRGLAERRHAVALRLLAVLAEHGGRRRRALPAPVHRPAPGRDPPAGGPDRRRRKRGQEGPGDRGDPDVAWRGGGGGGGRSRSGGLRGRRPVGGHAQPDLESG
jgi:hypothetical protein